MKHPYTDRYIYAVTKRLPASMREEVKAELEANIADMMAEDPDNEVLLLEKLRKLGHPRVLANNYRGSERYVIRPEYYDDYVSTLKIVGTIFLIVGLVTGFVEAITSLPNPIFPQVIETVLNGIFDNLWEALLTAFAWTTIGFWIAGTVGQKRGQSDWKLNDLPELPEKQTLVIGRVGTIVEMIVSVSFGLIFVSFLRTGLPFFNQSVVDPFIPFFYLSIALDLVLGITKLIYGQWRWPVIAVQAVEHLYSILFVLFFLATDFLNVTVFQTIADNSEFSLAQVIQGFERGKTVLIWLIVIGSLIDVIQILVKKVKAPSAD